ncbi:hypothetical protein FRC07_002724 [Ceratobasidium sp. 392]|nr:hypothetical protein FRC07_002724 [Ceratobasidium sp. 392]
MKLCFIVCGVGLLSAAGVSAGKNGLPVDKVYGVNLGSWLLSEPWMFPKEWRAMGGEVCDDCSTCVASELSWDKTEPITSLRNTGAFFGALATGKRYSAIRETWFTQEHVDAIADAGLNTVRIPLGYWIVEPLVHRSTEFYPRGGLKWLQNGLHMLKAKNINVILDFHALPGVSSSKQMFAGRCTSDVQFYTPRNYRRALVWAGVMAAVTHIDPDFSTVFAIEAINEPEMDYNKTPGLGDYEKNFVKVIRMVELALGIKCSDADYNKLFTSSAYASSINLGILRFAQSAEPVMKEVLGEVVSCLPKLFADLELDVDLKSVIGDIGEPPSSVGSADASVGNVEVPHGHALERHKAKKWTHRARGMSATLNKSANRQCLVTSFMNKGWQRNNPVNPADAAIGPQLYDAHLYFSFGGVADPNAESYMRVICNTDRVAKATAEGNRPLVFGEWSLATNFNANEQFLHDWSDAQRHIYAGQADGWIFWNFKIEPGSVYVPAWTYLDALKAGYFGKDPSKPSNPNVCAPWATETSIST